MPGIGLPDQHTHYPACVSGLRCLGHRDLSSGTHPQEGRQEAADLQRWGAGGLSPVARQREARQRAAHDPRPVRAFPGGDPAALLAGPPTQSLDRHITGAGGELSQELLPSSM